VAGGQALAGHRQVDLGEVAHLDVNVAASRQQRQRCQTPGPRARSSRSY
jgi:hypothetical protein